MATKRSKNMLSSPEDAMSVNPWMKNSWAAQASAEIPMALNKEVLSVVGRAEGAGPGPMAPTWIGNTTRARAGKALS